MISEVGDLEAAVRTFLDDLLDGLVDAAESLVLCDKSDTAKVNCIFVVGTKCQLMVAKTASAI